MIRSGRTRILVFLMFFACTMAQHATSGGLESGVPSARAIGLGGATSAITGEASTIFSNNASLSFLHGTHLTLGATVTMPDYEFSGVLPSTATSKMTPQSLFPPAIALSHTFANGLAVGIAATIPHYVKTNWGQTWVGSHIVSASEIRGVQLSPSVAFRIGPHVAAGIGLQAVFVRMDHSRSIGSVADSSTGRFPTMSMTGSADVAYGFELGLMYSPSDALALSLSLRGRTTAEITTGTVTYSSDAGESSSTAPGNNSFSTNVTIPERIRAGVMLRPFDGLLLTGELDLTRWSVVKGMTIRIGSPATSRIVDQSGWKDVVGYRGGVEVALADIMLRAGAGYEVSPIPDAELRPSIPDADCFHYGFGFGYAVEEGLMLDLGVQVDRYADRTVTNSAVLSGIDEYFNGTYKLSSTVIALTISYSWK
jgi:long-chain fatty acid transport protein